MILTDLSAREQLAGLARGDFSAVDLMQATLARIDAVNPSVNAIVSLRDPEVLLAEARAPKPGPLSGLPMAIKDLAETKGLRTSFGSPIYADHVPKADDLMVVRLRAAGAIIIGKTNTPEMGLGSHTYNPIFGATRNAYAFDRSSGGSSGGAAVALATRMVSLADGSDMMGSLRNPPRGTMSMASAPVPVSFQRRRRATRSTCRCRPPARWREIQAILGCYCR